MNDLKASILQGDQVVKASAGGAIEPEVINKALIPKIIQHKYPDLTAEEVEGIRQHIVVDSAIKNGEVKQVGGKKFVRFREIFL